MKRGVNIAMMNENVLKKLEQSGIAAVLELDSVDDAVPAAKALIAGGVTAIELALRTPAAEPAIPIIRKEVPELLLGIGTLIMPGQAERVKHLGADFALAPGYNGKIVQEAQDCGLSFAPGVATASEIEAALAAGCTFLKFFPAASLGGASYLKSVSAPYKHLGLQYFPLGGISEQNMIEYAALPQVTAVGGTWIAPRSLIQAKNWTEIESRARKAVEIWKNARIKKR